MPSMADLFAYFAPLASSDDEVWAYRKNVSRYASDFDLDCMNAGLVRGVHYTVKPLSKADIADIVESEGHKYPSRVPIFEVRFRSKKHLQNASSAGVLKDAEGTDAEKPIWG